jgi:hypothetical protein
VIRGHAEIGQTGRRLLLASIDPSNNNQDGPMDVTVSKGIVGIAGPASAIVRTATRFGNEPGP